MLNDSGTTTFVGTDTDEKEETRDLETLLHFDFNVISKDGVVQDSGNLPREAEFIWSNNNNS